jgi:hypothetical protein
VSQLASLTFALFEDEASDAAGDADVASSSAAAVPAPPVPVVGRKPRFANPNWPVADRGWLVLDISQNSLDAHCSCLKHVNKSNPCRLNRTLNSGGPSSQGRPLGLLVAWLFASRGCQKEHKNMLIKKLQTPADLEDLSYDKRKAARVWARSNGLGHLEGLESPKGCPSNDEPLTFY